MSRPRRGTHSGPTASIAEAALSSGKSVFCEKPLSVTLEDANALRNLVEESEALFQMGFMRRYDPGYAAAKEKIEGGTLGRSVMFKSSSRDPYRPSLDYLDPESSGGIFVDMGIHDFDLELDSRLWFMGPVREVFSTGGVLVYPEIGQIGDIDNAVVSLQFENGAIGQVDLSRNQRRADRATPRLDCRDLRLRYLDRDSGYRGDDSNRVSTRDADPGTDRELRIARHGALLPPTI